MRRAITILKRPSHPAVGRPVEEDLSKKPFDIHSAMRRIRARVRALPKAALFQLAEEGYDSPLEQLIACIISIRTRDEVTLPAARNLFQSARTAKALSSIGPKAIDHLIRASTFHQAKAYQIRDIAAEVETRFQGKLPCDPDIILSFRGVGPKCANLVLGIACGMSRIGVDVHVHRVTNRWGYVATKTPEQTLAALQEALPRKYWVEINRLLVPFGKHVCTGVAPKCSTCPVLDMCQQVGVRDHR